MTAGHMTTLLGLSRRWHLGLLTLLTLLMSLPGLASIPVIDRDEARYATSSVQMAQSGDWLEIRFHDQARNKKPAGAYWAQAALLRAVAGPDELRAGVRPLWAQRLPSVVAGLVAVWLTYAAGLILLGRGGAFIAAGMLASAMIFVVEAHLAKTDALLLASTTAMLFALMRLRVDQARGSAWLFWIAAGVSLMIKGPIGPGVALLCLLALAVWERRARWMAPLLAPLPILAFLLLWVPWLIAIDHATDGAFLAESLGRDLGGKMVSAQENHSGPPGYYALTVFVSLWPAVLFLLPGLVWGWTRARTSAPTRTRDPVRLCLAWVVPFWIVLEIAPTKLIHYPLPLFPALCLLMGGAVLGLVERGGFGRSRTVSGALFALGGVGIVGIILTAQVQYGAPGLTVVSAAVGLASVALALTAALALWRGRTAVALCAGLLSTILLSVPTYGLLIPGIEDGRTSQKVSARISGPIHSLHYTEPSLIYYAGSDRVTLPRDARWEPVDGWRGKTLLLNPSRGVSVEQVRRAVAAAGRCVEIDATISGFKYSNFDAVELVPVRQVTCGGA